MRVHQVQKLLACHMNRIYARACIPVNLSSFPPTDCLEVNDCLIRWPLYREGSCRSVECERPGAQRDSRHVGGQVSISSKKPVLFCFIHSDGLRRTHLHVAMSRRGVPSRCTACFGLSRDGAATEHRKNFVLHLFSRFKFER
jgi:hypothetical protein